MLKNWQGNRNDRENEQGKMIDKGSNKWVGEDDWESNEEESWRGGGAGDENSGLTSRFSSCGSLGEKDLGNF